MGSGLTTRDIERLYHICRASWNCWERGDVMSPKWISRMNEITGISIETLSVMKKGPTVSLSKLAQEYEETHPTIVFKDTDTYLKTVERYK